MQRTDHLANPPETLAAYTQTAEPQVIVAQNARPALFRSAFVILLLVALAIPASAFAYGAAYDGRVYRGVKALGADLGGMSKAEAQAALTRAGAGYPGGSIAVQAGSRTWNFTPAELGASLDVDKTLSSAMKVGRSGNFMADLSAKLGALFSGAQVTPALKYDSALVDKAVARVAGEIDKPALDSKLQQGSDGKVAITSSAAGSLLDRNALRGALGASLVAMPFAPVQATVREQAPKVTEAALRSSEAQALLLTEQPVILKSGKQTWTVQPEDLRGMLALSATPTGGWEAMLDRVALANYLKPVADKVRVSAQDADVVIGKGTVTLKPDVPGSELDMAAATTAIAQAAQATDPAGRTVVLPLKETPATIKADQVQALYSKADALVDQGIRLRFKEDGYILRGSSVTGFIDVAKAQSGLAPLKLVVDEKVLSSRISGVAYNINRKATDARFSLVNGTPTRLNQGTDGLKVNVAPSLSNAVKAIEAFNGTDKLQVDLDVTVTPPTLKDADVSAINTPDLLATGQTSYAGSSPERAWNVELGSQKLNGALIPPGGIFSTADTIGDLTLEAGFKMGYGIMSTPNGLTTAPSPAGGICQVSTTLFHAVFRAGLPIVERNWHSYWIALYGLPPSGLQGLDATIAPPEKDFRFKNTTGKWLRIEATADKKNVTIKIYGVNPGWKIQISQPIITNIVKSTPEMVYEKSNALPAGYQVLVEHAQNGFDASITRIVSDASGNVIDKWTGNSQYLPARNRTLIGTRPKK